MRRKLWLECRLEYRLFYLYFSHQDSTPPSIPDGKSGNLYQSPIFGTYIPGFDSPEYPCTQSATSQTAIGAKGLGWAIEKNFGLYWRNSALAIVLPKKYSLLDFGRTNLSLHCWCCCTRPVDNPHPWIAMNGDPIHGWLRSLVPHPTRRFSTLLVDFLPRDG